MNKMIIIALILVTIVGVSLYLLQNREKETGFNTNNDMNQVDKKDMEEDEVIQIVHTLIKQNQTKLEKYEGDKREIEKFLYPRIVRNVRGQASPAVIKNAISKVVNEIY